ncbi:putative NADPH-quinone reductase [Chryseobacterium nepalense]|nr:putative NADPH-quinone reductase [Chryseobacterium nepalense]
MKKILIIDCHPNKESFNFGISESYKNALLNTVLK